MASDLGRSAWSDQHTEIGEAMNWRKQIQEHIRDAEEVATNVVIRLASDSNKERKRAAQYVPDIDAAFDRIEQRLSNARRLWEENRA